MFRRDGSADYTIANRYTVDTGSHLRGHSPPTGREAFDQMDILFRHE
jgi:hypothetical protein